MQMEARVGVAVDGGGVRKLVQPPPPKHIGTVSQLLAGGVAGAFSKSCTAPLARLTILFQIQGMHSNVATLRKASIWNEASRIIHEEGFGAFWKGNLVTIAHRLPYSSVNFYSYEHYKKLLKMVPGLQSHRDNVSADLCVHFVGGGLAGVTAATTTYPLDLVRTRLAAQTNFTYYRGIWHALHTISKEEGIFGLYKGLGTTLLTVGPSIAISFSVYETLRSYWQSNRSDDSPAVVSLACGSLSGIASSTVKNPLVKLLNLLNPRTSKKLMSVVVYYAFDAEKESLVQELHQVLCPFATTNVCSATFPLDLVRRRKQLEGAGGRARVYTTGLYGVFRHIIQTEGVRGLYRGILPEYYKVVPGVGICFMTYETLKMLLADIGTA
ncbi:Mitochondrial substrate carrier family protein B [Glycine max]|nr:Mitochondrial substrate carrier family protein B [Glycine max]